MKTKGERISEALKMRGMRKADLARLLYQPRGTISNWCNNRYQPNDEMVERMAMILNVNSAWLHGFDAPISRDSQYDTEGREQRIDETIIIAYHSADEKIQKAIRVLLGIDL